MTKTCSILLTCAFLALPSVSAAQNYGEMSLVELTEGLAYPKRNVQEDCIVNMHRRLMNERDREVALADLNDEVRRELIADITIYMMKCFAADQNDYVVERACEILGCFGPDSKASLPDLIGLLRKQPDGKFTRIVIETIGKIGSPEHDSVNLLARFLDTSDYRASAIDAISQVGSNSKPIRARILQFAQQQDMDAIFATGTLKIEEARPTLKQFIAGSDVNERVRLNALIALFNMDSRIPETMSIVERIANDKFEGDEIRRYAISMREVVTENKPKVASGN